MQSSIVLMNLLVFLVFVAIWFFLFELWFKIGEKTRRKHQRTEERVKSEKT